MKKKIRLTEAQLIGLINKTIKNILSEQTEIEKSILGIEDDDRRLNIEVQQLFDKLIDPKMDYSRGQKLIEDGINKYFTSPNVMVFRTTSATNRLHEGTIEEFLSGLCFNKEKVFLKGGITKNGKWDEEIFITDAKGMTRDNIPGF